MVAGARTAQFSMLSNKFQVGVAAMAIATAATVTPVMAQAAPNAVTFAEGIGSSVDQYIQPVIDVSPRSSVAAVTAAPVCTTTDIGCVLGQALQGVGQGLNQVVVAFTTAAGTVVYATLSIAGGIITTVGAALPGPIGAAISAVGQAFLTGAESVAKTVHIGPYSTAV
jgi:hypothetical protein